MDFKIKIISILLGIITAAFETIGAIGSGTIWSTNSSDRIKGVLLIIFGFGGSIIVYILLRRFVTDFIIAQAFFIGGIALFAVLITIFIHKSFHWEIVIGLFFITIGAIVINRIVTNN